MKQKIPVAIIIGLAMAGFQLPSQAQYFPGFPGFGEYSRPQQQGRNRCRGYAGIGGPCYAGIGGPLYDGIGGPCYAGIGGPCYAGIGGTGEGCSPDCP